MVLTSTRERRQARADLRGECRRWTSALAAAGLRSYPLIPASLSLDVILLRRSPLLSWLVHDRSGADTHTRARIMPHAASPVDAVGASCAMVPAVLGPPSDCEPPSL